MNDDFLPSETTADPAANAREDHTLGSSTIYKLCDEVIRLRETNNRQHRLFEQTITKTRDELTSNWNSFAKATQEAYQKLRQETVGEKRISMALLNELLEVGMDLEHIMANKPAADNADAMGRWVEAVEIEARKVQAALLRHGIHPYDAVISAPYNPALHERIGSTKVEGMGPNLVAEQRERGYASQQPEFVLRRPKVIVSE
jgi:molecular chaperone GrpE (heat shock protein)